MEPAAWRRLGLPARTLASRAPRRGRSPLLSGFPKCPSALPRAFFLAFRALFGYPLNSANVRSGRGRRTPSSRERYVAYEAPKGDSNVPLRVLRGARLRAQFRGNCGQIRIQLAGDGA